MSLQDAVLDIVKEKGPLLPAEIVKETNQRTGKQTDMFFIGAVLSELMGSKLVKMSHAKVGGSRLYYCPGQEEGLQKLYDHLNDKEQKAFDMLKEHHVLRHRDLDPVIRVALSQMKDFSRTIEVKLTETEIFYAWYLLPLEEAQRKIKEVLQPEIDALKKSKETAQKLPEKPVEKAIEQEKSEVKKPQEPVKDDQAFILQQKSSQLQKASNTQQVHKKDDSQEKQSRLDSPFDVEDEFMKEVISYLQAQDITILEAVLLKKNSECEFVAKINSQIGKLTYYIYAKSKKKVNETDLSYAYVRAQNRNLPLCYITPGELTKKAAEALETDLKAANYLQMQ
ncbi:MAG: hypothetical protein ACOC32_01400 [Nanoarchaeota archaeon]